MKNILIPIESFSATLLKSILRITETAAMERFNIILVYIKPNPEDNRENNKTDKAVLKLYADYMDLRAKSKINISAHIAIGNYSEVVKAYSKKTAISLIAIPVGGNKTSIQKRLPELEECSVPFILIPVHQLFDSIKFSTLYRKALLSFIKTDQITDMLRA